MTSPDIDSSGRDPGWVTVAAAMFPEGRAVPADYEAQYPPRALKEGARVTRIAPSPTGYLHLGVFYSAVVDRLTADASGGLFYFRLEETGRKRASSAPATTARRPSAGS